MTLKDTSHHLKHHHNSKRTPKQHISKLKLAIISVILVLLGFGLFYGYIYINQQIEISQARLAEEKRIAEKKAIADALEVKRNEPVYINLPNANQIRAIVDDYDAATSIWKLVGKTNPISIDYVPSNLIVPGVATRTDKSIDEQSVRADIEQPLKDLFGAAANASNQLMIGSGYRPASLQTLYFNSAANAYGEEAASQSIARPGQSEHQLGLAVDLTTTSRECYLEACFGDTADGKWLENNSYKFGFILRYPSDKVAVTGYQYEPWHFRYVGVDLATALHDSGLTLDEAWPYIQTALTTLRNNGAVSR